ncbi:Uncharacterized protein APZ42_009518 [Daphnia magna]|uniref:Uncharacterized protein n=1 Tax=Daphnia magna TaxID=35525 RepID=A0A0P5XP71_9CRUS|nr:Uncharacterized protein APZ42_009518 [Daphnia magna]
MCNNQWSMDNDFYMRHYEIFQAEFLAIQHLINTTVSKESARRLRASAY